MTVAAPLLVGVSIPELLTVPMLEGLTDHVTALLKLPMPFTVEAQVEVCVVKMAVGEQVTKTEVIVGAALTVISAVPDWVLSWTDVAITVAVPVVAGVKTPALLTVPTPDGLTDQLTEFEKLPVPRTVAEHVDVWVAYIEPEEQTTETEVTVTGTFTTTDAEPDLVESCADVAATLAIPAPLGVNTPADVIMPPVAVQVTPDA